MHPQLVADNTEVYGSVDLLEGSKTLQRDVDRLGRWAEMNVLRFSKAKCQVLPLCCNNPMQCYTLGEDTGKISARKRLEGADRWPPNMRYCVPRWPRRPVASWLVPVIMWPTGPGQ